MKLTPTPIRADPSRLSDRVAIELGSRIVRGDLLPGSRLPTEAELCELFGVSRSVIRDAIRVLSARGLVHVRQGHGMVVYPASDATFAEALIILLMRSDVTIGDVIDARAVIETELAPLVVEHGTEADLEGLRLQLHRYEAAVEDQNWLDAQDAHFSFHFSLLESIHLPALHVLLKPMQQIILLSSLPVAVAEKDLWKVWTSEDVARHHPVMSALENRDAEGVRRAMDAHFSAARENKVLAAERGVLFGDSQAAQTLLHDMLSAKSAPSSHSSPA
jgi:GntR family transcriptional repressor for pyruvate dehydrogenase complex